MASMIDRKSLFDIGRFWAAWSGIELDLCWAVGKFLSLPAEDTHRLTSGMMFGPKASLVRTLVKRSAEPKKPAILGALGKLQNDSKRNINAHGFLGLLPTKGITFLNRSVQNGEYTCAQIDFGPSEFARHVDSLLQHSEDFRSALELTGEMRQQFGLAALTTATKPDKSPVPPSAKA